MLPLLLAAALCGPPAPRTLTPAHPVKPPAYRLSTSLVIAGSGLALDYATTAYGLRHGARELNPMGVSGTVAVSTLGCLGGVYAAHKSGHPKAARVGAWFCGGLHAGYAAANVRTIRRR